MQVITVALFQRTGALGNSFLIKGDSPRTQTFWGQKFRGSSQFIDVDFSCCLQSHALSIYQKINSVAITFRFHTKIL